MGLIDTDLNQKREFDKSNPVKAATVSPIGNLYDLENVTRETHDYAYSVKLAKSTDDAFEQIDRTNEICDRLLGCTPKN